MAGHPVAGTCPARYSSIARALAEARRSFDSLHAASAANANAQTQSADPRNRIGWLSTGQVESGSRQRDGVHHLPLTTGRNRRPPPEQEWLHQHKPVAIGFA